MVAQENVNRSAEMKGMKTTNLFSSFYAMPAQNNKGKGRESLIISLP